MPSVISAGNCCKLYVLYRSKIKMQVETRFSIEHEISCCSLSVQPKRYVRSWIDREERDTKNQHKLGCSYMSKRLPQDYWLRPKHVINVKNEVSKNVKTECLHQPCLATNQYDRMAYGLICVCIVVHSLFYFQAKLYNFTLVRLQLHHLINLM